MAQGQITLIKSPWGTRCVHKYGDELKNDQ